MIAPDLISEEFEPLAESPVESAPEPTPYSVTILRALWLLPVIYAGTVPRHVKARRRRQNKAARRSRRINRVRA